MCILFLKIPHRLRNSASLFKSDISMPLRSPVCTKHFSVSTASHTGSGHKLTVHLFVCWIAQSVCRLFTTGWADLGFNPDGSRLSAHVQPGTGAHLASCAIVTGSISRGVQRPRRGSDIPLSSSPGVNVRVELYPYSPSMPSWQVVG